MTTSYHKASGPSLKSVNLMKGWPSPDLLPPLLLRDAAQRTLSQTNRSTITEILEYGDDEGYLPLRESIASWLTDFYAPKDPISPTRLTITGGASQNLANVLSTFTDPVYTHHVWMVAPTYYLACRIFADAGFDGRLRAVPEDAQGVDVGYLDQALANSSARDGGQGQPLKQPKPWRKLFRHVIYCVPTFANPSGRIMSQRRREDLVKLARKYDALLISDDVYDMLQFSSDPHKATKRLDKAHLPRLVDIDRYLDGGPVDSFGNCLSNGSFSKIVSPGCRTGWAEGTPALAWGLAQTGGSRSGGAPSHLVATFLHDMIVQGTLSKHVFEFLQPKYAKRYHILISAIEKHLMPLGITVPQPDKVVAGGYFIWLRLPGRLKADMIYQSALQMQNLTIITGPKFRVDGDEKAADSQFDQNIRLCFAWEDEELLEEGVVRLSKVIRSCQDQL
jgi:DNA-binding transcriptional MocR family regulator